MKNNRIKISEDTQRKTYDPIRTVDDLMKIREELDQQFPEHLLLFRGQNSDYQIIRSGLARSDVRLQPDVEQGWRVLAGLILGDEGESFSSTPFRKAVLQHYGLPTHYIDVTSDIEVAAWFASNKYESRNMVWGGNPPRRIKQASYMKREQGIGFIIVMAIPKHLQQSDRIIDLSHLKPFVRPQRQKAWLIYDRQPLLPDPNDFWVATIRVDCQFMSLPFTTEYLFPPPLEDPGYARLLNFPFLQVPSFLLCKNEERDKEIQNPSDIQLAMRAIDVPDYVNTYGDKHYNHKWNDITLFEPTAMQSWVNWTFPLGDLYPGFNSDINEATKLTLSPRALEILYEHNRNVPLQWPELGSSNLLFTFSQYAHDKVDDIEFPFEGVWLHKDQDLILEHQVTADMNVMNIHAGHAYQFIGGQLAREQMLKSCICSKPEIHDIRVQAMLRLSSLLKMEKIVLVQHPMGRGFSKWFLVL